MEGRKKLIFTYKYEKRRRKERMKEGRKEGRNDGRKEKKGGRKELIKVKETNQGRKE